MSYIKKMKGGNTIFKLYITKAYDNIDRDYLFKLLIYFIFMNKLLHLLKIVCAMCGLI